MTLNQATTNLGMEVRLVKNGWSTNLYSKHHIINASATQIINVGLTCTRGLLANDYVAVLINLTQPSSIAPNLVLANTSVINSGGPYFQIVKLPW